ncbi:hypothetical protein XELAEV_18003230mg [Xenopus laevis]|uniref:Uncharacterized protein n=1 Tax=Xenopus laevis TaxID=8355 RepID=A0A974GYJ1_XENLA|nr:hypothetical protein XELAEV_18003230mg [Xenopus laevis]
MLDRLHDLYSSISVSLVTADMLQEAFSSTSVLGKEMSHEGKMQFSLQETGSSWTLFKDVLTIGPMTLPASIRSSLAS